MIKLFRNLLTIFGAPLLLSSWHEFESIFVHPQCVLLNILQPINNTFLDPSYISDGFQVILVCIDTRIAYTQCPHSLLTLIIYTACRCQSVSRPLLHFSNFRSSKSHTQLIEIFIHDHEIGVVLFAIDRDFVFTFLLEQNDYKY